MKVHRTKENQAPITDLIFSKVDLRKLIIPLVIENILLMSVGFADSLMVSNVGEAALSSVALVDSISILMIYIFTALATGGSVVAAQFIGQKSLEKARESGEQLVLVTLLISGVIFAVCMIFNAQILRLIFGGIEDAVMQNARTYFYLSALSYPFLALYNAGAALFRACGNSKVPMINAGIMNIINVVFNAIFIFGFGWGVFGAGLATLMGRAFACISVLFLLTKKKYDLHIINYLRIRWNYSYIKKIFAIGVPSGIENGMFQFGKILLQSLVATIGTFALAADSVAASLNAFMLIPVLAINLAVITVVGQCVGAKRYDQVEYYIKKLLKLAYLTTSALGILIILLSPFILKAYSLSKETQDLAYKCICIHAAFAIFIWPLSFTLPNAMRAANDAKYILVVSMASMWICRIAFAYILVRVLNVGLIGTWLAMGADWSVRSIFFVWRYFSGKWKNRELI